MAALALSAATGAVGRFSPDRGSFRRRSYRRARVARRIDAVARLVSPGSPSSSAAFTSASASSEFSVTSSQFARARRRDHLLLPAPRALTSPESSAPAPGSGGFGFLATEEEADADAAERLARLRALVARKRLCFAIIQAAETAERDIPDRGAKLSALGNSDETLEELADAVDDYERRCADVRDCEAQIARLEKYRNALFAAAAEPALIFDDPDAAKTAIDAKVRECTEKLVACGAQLLRSLPYDSLDEAAGGVDEARERLEDAFDGDARLRPVVKTVERVGSRVKSTRGLLTRGVGKLREKPLSAAASAAEYTKGVWSRLNGGADGASTREPSLDGVPEPTSNAEKRAARVLCLTLEVQDRDKALGEASAARDKVMGQGKDSLGRVRLAKTIRETEELVASARRVAAVRALQVEMERIIMQLEEEAAEVTSLDATDRSDEVELLVEEFGAMDASLRKLVSTVDRGASELISDEDLTELATDIPDLKSRLGIADEGMGTLSPEVLGERISRTATESAEKAREGAEFMARGVKMLGGDISASARFFGRAAMGSTLRPREVQTIRRTALDIFTFVPFIIILIVPLTPVGHVLIFSFIQRYFPALFPSQFSGRRQELMKKYEELSLQLKEAERREEIREEDEALKRAVTAVESLMMGGASDAEVAKAAAAATATANDANRTNSFFKLKGLERMASGEDVVDVDAERVETQPETLDREKEEPAEAREKEALANLRESAKSMEATLSLHEEEEGDDADNAGGVAR